MRWGRIAAMTVVAVALPAIGSRYVAPKSPSEPVVQPLHMERITLQRTPCFGRCPVYTVTVERDGRATFRATRFVPSKEDPERLLASNLVWHARVPDASLRAILAAVESPGYARLDPDYSIMITDTSSTVLTVEGDGRTHRTHVSSVPCLGELGGKPVPEELAEVGPVPDVFCAVEQLVDIASCARYWDGWSRGSFTVRKRVPPRCKPMP